MRTDEAQNTGYRKNGITREMRKGGKHARGKGIQATLLGVAYTSRHPHPSVNLSSSATATTEESSAQPHPPPPLPALSVAVSTASILLCAVLSFWSSPSPAIFAQQMILPSRLARANWAVSRLLRPTPIVFGVKLLEATFQPLPSNSFS